MLSKMSMSDKIELIKSGAIFVNPENEGEKALFYKGYSFLNEADKEEEGEFITLYCGSGFQFILSLIETNGYTLYKQGYAWVRGSGKFYSALDTQLDALHYARDLEGANPYSLYTTLNSGRVVSVSCVMRSVNELYEEENETLKAEIQELKEGKAENGEAYKAGYEAAKKEFEEALEAAEREYFRKGWERAKTFHTENNGWTKKEKKKSNYSGMSDREKLGAILGVNPYEKDATIWKKARRRYLLENHSDRNPNSDPEEVAEMNALWDKVFG
ncbi:MAG: hypothetical protein ACRDCE_15560 [Cetobacterium sp.]|uniref:hypothetical protein n=1 Tax=Cetobacterium sp. TaxID=2071632 RepID=UPI003EE63B58